MSVVVISAEAPITIFFGSDWNRNIARAGCQTAYAAVLRFAVTCLSLLVACASAPGDEISQPDADRAPPPVDRAPAPEPVAVALEDLDEALRAHLAKGELERVIALWRDMSTQAVAAWEPKRVGGALTIVGEALFAKAERARDAFDAIALPPYEGDRSTRSVNKYINGPMRRWMDDKRAALRDAEAAYEEIVLLKPATPPKWVVAGAERVGAMYAGFVEQFRNPPYPSQWDTPGEVAGTTPPMTYAEIRQTFFDQIAAASEPQLRRATIAYRVCRDWADKHEIDNAFSKRCIAWLAKKP